MADISSKIARAKVLMVQERYDAALKEWESVLGHYPGEDYVHLMICECLINTNRLSDANQYLISRVWQETDTQARAYYLLSVTATRQGRFIRSIRTGKKAVQLNPVCADYYGHLAVVYESIGFYREGWRLVRQGLSIDPVNEKCLFAELVLLPRANGLYEGWKDVVSATLTVNPESAGFYAASGWLSLDDGKPKVAKAYFLSALRLSPNYEWPRLGLIKALKMHIVTYWLVNRIKRKKYRAFAELGGIYGLGFLSVIIAESTGLDGRQAFLGIVTTTLLIHAGLPRLYLLYCNRQLPLKNFLTKEEKLACQRWTIVLIMLWLLAIANLFFNYI